MPQRWSAVLLAACFAMPLSAQLRPQHRFALTAGHVAQSIVKALSQQGFYIAEEQIAVPSNMVATQPSPGLDLGSFEPLDYSSAPQRSRVKLSCHLPSACLPFYAVVSWPSNSPAPLPANIPTKAGVTMMAAGTHATLLMDDGRAQIQMPVVSLERGPVGRRIRVATPDHKRMYLAEVVTANQLKASF